MSGTFCALHRKMELAKSNGTATGGDPVCGYCRRKGSPCSRHGGEPSYQVPKTQRVPASGSWGKRVAVEETAPEPTRVGFPSKVDASDRPDAEITVLDTVAKSLRTVDAAARRRIMTYLNSRYQEEPTT